MTSNPHRKFLSVVLASIIMLSFNRDDTPIVFMIEEFVVTDKNGSRLNGELIVRDSVGTKRDIIKRGVFRGDTLCAFLGLQSFDMLEIKINGDTIQIPNFYDYISSDKVHITISNYSNVFPQCLNIYNNKAIDFFQPIRVANKLTCQSPSSVVIFNTIGNSKKGNKKQRNDFFYVLKHMKTLD